MTNVIVISGNLTKDPEVRGGTTLSFSIAYNDRYKDKTGQYVDRVSFFNIVKFSTENACNYLSNNLRKGMKVTITGKLQQNIWESKDGTTNYDVQIIAGDIDFFHQNNKQNNQANQNNKNNDYNTDSYYNRDESTNFGSMYSQDNNIEMDPY